MTVRITNFLGISESRRIQCERHEKIPPFFPSLGLPKAKSRDGVCGGLKDSGPLSSYVWIFGSQLAELFGKD